MGPGIDEQRARWLDHLGILDAPVDPIIEQVCTLARTLFDMPFAFVNMLSDDKAHIIAHEGLAFVSVPRADSLCDVTVRQDEPVVIPDTQEDTRFRDNVFVLGTPQFRFYAGVSLSVAPGVRLGTLCIADTKPRPLTAMEIASLRQLAEIVAAQLAHHASRRDLALKAAELARKQAILSQTERFAMAGGFEADPFNREMTLSDELHRICGFAHDARPTLDSFIDLFEPGGQIELRDGIAKLARTAAPFDMNTRMARAGEDDRYVHIHIEPRVEDATTVKLVGLVQDVTARETALRAYRWIATHDGLTKISNRSAFNDLIDDAIRIADQFGQRVALIMLDVDRFKTINDTLGHDVGDAVLVTVADRLQAAVGARGQVARIGGDEFAVLVSRFDAEGQLASLATDILLSLRKPFHHRKAEINMRATLGVALTYPDESSAASLFKDADIALYNAKKAGRDGFAFYRPSMRAELDDQIDKLHKARGAVFAGRIEPYYQPKIDLSTGRCVGFEALMRWHHPSKGLCAPGEMGDAFADTELAVAIGRGMLERVADDLAAWRKSGLDVGTIAINAAGPEFYNGDYAKRLLSCLGKRGLPANAIEVEVTESVFLDHHSGVVGETLATLAQAGVSIALDDFGTGFASLTHLKQYPVTTIKIDRSFVMDIETDPDAAAIVDALTSLAHSLSIAVVAEGVESSAQLAFLQARGCTTGQGYLFAKPMAASRVAHFIRNWTMLARTESPERPRRIVNA